MKKIDVSFIFAGKYLKLFLTVFVLVVSIKPFLFTWNFIRAAFTLREDPGKAGVYMLNTLSYKPSVYKIFNEYYPRVIESYLVKSAVYAGAGGLPDTLPPGLERSKIRSKFRDNFYFQYIQGNIDRPRDWANLDEVSFDLLADQSMNATTLSIIPRIDARLDRVFIKNLSDFASWRGNRELSRRLISRYNVGEPLFSGGELTAGPGAAGDSAAGVKVMLWETYKLSEKGVGKNLLQAPGFGGDENLERHWYFSMMAGKKAFSRGSFVMGVHRIGKNRNPVICLMGFFVSHDPGKSRPRAGVRYRKKIPAQNGYYVFSFDYCTVTGREMPSFRVSAGLEEKRLPYTRGKWQKMLLVLNNSANKHQWLDPLVRMWGTGTLLVDNVFLAKIKTPAFSIAGPLEIFFQLL